MMKLAHYFLALATVCLVGTAALADSWNRETHFTSDQAFVIPGALYANHQTMIPAGAYVLKLSRTQGVPSAVMLYDEGQQHLLASALPIRVSRRDGRATDRGYGDELVQFEAGRVEGAPARLINWFYPGTDEGFGFREQLDAE